MGSAGFSAQSARANHGPTQIKNTEITELAAPSGAERVAAIASMASHELAAHTLTYTLRAPSEALIESELQSFRAFWRVRVDERGTGASLTGRLPVAGIVYAAVDALAETHRAVRSTAANLSLAYARRMPELQA